MQIYFLYAQSIFLLKNIEFSQLDVYVYICTSNLILNFILSNVILSYIQKSFRNIYKKIYIKNILLFSAERKSI